MAHEYTPESSNDRSLTHQVDEKVSDSIRLGYEQPHREFDNTTLAQAVDMGLPKTPDSPAALTQHKKPEKKDKKRAAAIGGSLLAAAVAAGGGYLALGGEDDSRDRRTTTSASNDTNGTEPGSNAVEDERSWPQPGAEEISAEVYTTPEAVVAAYEEQLNNWYSAGATIENKTSLRDEFSGTRSEFAAVLAEEYAEPYVDALFVPGWEADASLAGAVEAERDIHAAALDWYLVTAGDEPEDVEPYKRGIEFTEVEASDATSTSFVTTVRFAEFDNSANNRVADYKQEWGQEDVNDRTGGQIITWELVGGAWKVADIEPNGR